MDNQLPQPIKKAAHFFGKGHTTHSFFHCQCIVVSCSIPALRFIHCALMFLLSPPWGMHTVWAMTYCKNRTAFEQLNWIKQLNHIQLWFATLCDVTKTKQKTMVIQWRQRLNLIPMCSMKCIKTGQRLCAHSSQYNWWQEQVAEILYHHWSTMWIQSGPYPNL